MRMLERDGHTCCGKELREMGMFSLEEKELQEELTAAFLYS